MKCHICIHCNDSYHKEYPEDYDGYEPEDPDATYDHYEEHEDGTHEFTDIVWDKDNYSWCKAKIKCAERYCDHLWSDEELECDVEESSLTDSEGKTYRVFTATYNGELVAKEYPDGKPPYTPGDVDRDGEIKQKDAIILLRHLAKWDGYEDIDELAADVDRDGEVKQKDAIILLRYLAKWDGVELK